MKFRDPDVASLIESRGGIEPRALVLDQARTLLSEYRIWNPSQIPALARVKILASLRGFTVSPMEAHHDNQRDAVVVRKLDGRGGQIFYNPSRPESRILFSIAHEIAHSFFPVTGNGIRFREMTADEPPERNELERLCDAGAAELLMPADEFQDAAGANWTVRNIERLMHVFGGSFEATLYRLASAYPGIAVAGSLRYRRTKADELKLKRLDCGFQPSLFGIDLSKEIVAVTPPKYRRQSFHMSSSCPKTFVIPWNKSFDVSSRVYQTDPDGIVGGIETLPVVESPRGILEAVDAPYQRSDSDPNHPDVLFYWKAA